MPTRRRFLSAAGALGLAGALAAGRPRRLAAQGQSALPRRGVNLSHWLSWEGRQPVVAADAQMIRAAGFDHVRLPVDPEFLGWNPEAGGAPPRLDRLDGALDLLLAAGLGVILSFHAREETRDNIELHPRFQDTYLALWRLLARRYAARPDGLAYEVMNEPQYYVRGPQRWDQLQRRVIAAIRAEDAGRLLVLSGIGGSGIDYIERTAPVADANCCFVFHFYEPYLVSHFGATWEPFDKEPAAMVGKVIYPSPDMTLADAALRYGPGRAAAERLVRDYIDLPWNAATIGRRIAVAAQWGARAGMRLMCTEFGALRTRLDPASRYRWLADVRQVLERQGIGWSVWDYADLFGIATARGDVERLDDGAVVPRDAKAPDRAFDPAALAALGL